MGEPSEESENSLKASHSPLSFLLRVSHCLRHRCLIDIKRIGCLHWCTTITADSETPRSCCLHLVLADVYWVSTCEHNRISRVLRAHESYCSQTFPLFPVFKIFTLYSISFESIIHG